MMSDLLVDIAHALPERTVLQILKSCIEAHLENETDKTRNGLRTALTMAIMNIMTKEQGIDKVTREVDEISRIRKMFRDLN